MVPRRIAAEFIMILFRYIRVYPAILIPGSINRQPLLSKGSLSILGPLAFFGLTTSAASFLYNSLARFAIDDIDLKSHFWQSLFELEILGVNLKNSCIEFLNGLIMAAFAFVIIRVCRQKVSYRQCFAAFLYAYAIAILLTTVWLLYANVFQTTAEPGGPRSWEWAFEGGKSLNAFLGGSNQAFTGERFFPTLPSYLTSQLQGNSIDFVPATFSIFNSIGVAMQYRSNWNELFIVIFLIDLKIVLATYILRPRILPAIFIVLTCSITGFFVDGVLSRYTSKHTLLAYVSARMQPTVQIGQAFKYSTSYFDNFPMKLAI